MFNKCTCLRLCHRLDLAESDETVSKMRRLRADVLLLLLGTLQLHTAMHSAGADSIGSDSGIDISTGVRRLDNRSYVQVSGESALTGSTSDPSENAGNTVGVQLPNGTFVQTTSPSSTSSFGSSQQLRSGSSALDPDEGIEMADGIALIVFSFLNKVLKFLKTDNRWRFSNLIFIYRIISEQTDN